jgi:hypothetical protein
MEARESKEARPIDRLRGRWLAPVAAREIPPAARGEKREFRRDIHGLFIAWLAMIARCFGVPA